uniref:Uncharacterized protein n=1 Tax=Nelumbo nucifera TaxID=4432 RepID=A0A822XSV9_NELNU|nr:TPA_asm: hypothetical protein HUJ06_023368 [Nelumbo nucifera]
MSPSPSSPPPPPSLLTAATTNYSSAKITVKERQARPNLTGGNANAGPIASSGPFSSLSRSSTIRHQSSRAMRRQRSGTSSKHTDKAEEFALSELPTATNNFLLENEIGVADGREMAIKRGETD